MQGTSLGEEEFCEFTPLCIHSFKSLCSQGPGHGMEHEGEDGIMSQWDF